MQHFEKYFSGELKMYLYNVVVEKAHCILSLAWKIHVCILITVYADYTRMNYDDRTFTHKDQGLNRETDCINKGPLVHVFKGCLRACSLTKF